MRLTRQGDYAVRVMVDLAAQAPDVAIRRAQIQARQDVPAAYLAKIIQALARAGLVRTRPGAHGGITLNAPAEAVTLLQVIEAVEGPIRLNRCVEAPGACPRDRVCPVHPVWMRLQALVTRELDGVTIAALARPAALPGAARLQTESIAMLRPATEITR
jgi:Rrf2 family iron-sulfur cluster assembly transcriptional regulator